MIKDIDFILRNFFWSGPDLSKRVAKMAWVDVSVPKKEGGVGIPNIHMCNRANMAQHLWNLASKKDTLSEMVPHLSVRY